MTVKEQKKTKALLNRSAFVKNSFTALWLPGNWRLFSEFRLCRILYGCVISRLVFLSLFAAHQEQSRNQQIWGLARGPGDGGLHTKKAELMSAAPPRVRQTSVFLELQKSNTVYSSASRLCRASSSRSLSVHSLCLQLWSCSSAAQTENESGKRQQRFLPSSPVTVDSPDWCLFTAVWRRSINSRSLSSILMVTLHLWSQIIFSFQLTCWLVSRNLNLRLSCTSCWKHFLFGYCRLYSPKIYLWSSLKLLHSFYVKQKLSPTFLEGANLHLTSFFSCLNCTVHTLFYSLFLFFTTKSSTSFRAVFYKVFRHFFSWFSDQMHQIHCDVCKYFSGQSPSLKDSNLINNGTVNIS